MARTAGFLLLLLAACVGESLAADAAVNGQLADQVDCVSTPTEFVEAFEAREPRCVSPDLFGRVASGSSVDDAAFTTPYTSKKLAYFWSGADVLAKYIRIGYPQSIGFSTVRNPSGLNATGGLGFLTQVGYPLEYSNVGEVYVLNILTRSALANASAELAADGLPYGGGVPPLSPTWEALRDYFQYVYAEAGLALSDAALGILQSTTFAALSGCPAQCAYVASAFPSANQTSPIITANPSKNSSCPMSTPGKQRTEATALSETSDMCAADWQEAYAAVSTLFDYNCSAAGNAAAGAALAKLLAGAADAHTEALLFRAFLFQYCAGDFDSLFSGNGITYTGFGGMLNPMGTEFITSGFLTDAWGPEHAAAIPICISGTNGGQPTADGTCELPLPRERGQAAGEAAPEPAPLGSGRKLLRA